MTQSAHLRTYFADKLFGAGRLATDRTAGRASTPSTACYDRDPRFAHPL